MIFEHFALNVENPAAIAGWYVKNCMMKIVKKMDNSPFTHFLADRTGRVVAEFYDNKNAEKIDMSKKDPLEFHFAFMVSDAEKEMNRLISGGASLEEDLRFDDGSHLVMLRDPFGLPLQICERAAPLMNIE